MKIGQLSMRVKDRYTTQSSTYDRLLIGKKLSDRRIRELEKTGFYGKEVQAKRVEERKRKQRKPKSNLLEGWI